MNTQHNFLRERFEQHKAKNDYSKLDDKNIKEAMDEVVKILSEAYPHHTFKRKASLTFQEIGNYLKTEFEENMNGRKMLPDGGVIWMDNKYPILISEAKRQGTNNERIKEGKAKQATGNAIERLGKNLIGFLNLYREETIFPFICFCWGCDFESPIVIAKLFTLNSFNPINQVYVQTPHIGLKPFTCLTKPDSAWTRGEIIDVALHVAEISIQYFEDKEYHG